jgi:hypothetical protein
MKVIKVNSFQEIPKNFTGVADYEDGEKRWYKDGERHREDGPAIEYLNGTKYWYKNGNLHREDGPAVEWSNEYKEWWFNGKNYKNKIPSNSIILDEYKDQRYQKITFYKVLTSEKIVTVPIWEELKTNE